MMPNDRGIEMLRFDGEDHALAGAFAVERLEQAIPDQCSGRSITRTIVTH